MTKRLAQGVVGVLAGCALATASAEDAASYPNRIVQIIVPYTPGTGADILSRIFGTRLGELWKVGVVTENRPGASGSIGTEAVAKAAPDGYTLLFVATSFGTMPALQPNLPFDPAKSFTPVSLVATSAMALLVSPQLPVRSVSEFLDLVRKQPGKLHYSSPGNGTPQHLAMELFKLDGRLDLVHVPYKGSSGAVTDLVGGHVDATIASLQTVAPLVQSGKLRMLAVLSATRSPAFAEVPTLKEEGYPSIDVETWYGLFAPSGTPADVVAKLNAEMNTLLEQASIREALAKQGMSPAGGPPERLGELVRMELARWSRVVAAAGIRAD
jgi:tripartite-type tricarboxylate transporter receptor subunit TctC